MQHLGKKMVSWISSSGSRVLKKNGNLREDNVGAFSVDV